MHTTDRRGHYVSDGIPVRARLPVGHPGTRGPVTGYVLATYGPDHYASISKSSVECDVVLEDRTLLFHVPVCVNGSSSPAICSSWRPNAVSRNIDTGMPLIFATVVPPPGIDPAMQYGPGLALVSDLSALDADHVLVEFLGGRVDKPMITQGVVHPRASRGIFGGDLIIPWTSDSVYHPMVPSGNVLFAQRGGTRAMIDLGGNIAIDTTHAPEGPDGGVPIPPQPEAGNVTLNLGSSSTITLRFLNSNTVLKLSSDPLTHQLKIDIGSEGATQPVILGTAFQALYDTHIHPAVVPGTPNTGVPIVLMAATPAVFSTKVKLDG